MTKRIVEVVQWIEVEMDDSKFDTPFMEGFQESFYHLADLNEHAEHIAELEVRGLLNKKFTEGYGPLEEMGISARAIYTKVEVINDD